MPRALVERALGDDDEPFERRDNLVSAVEITRVILLAGLVPADLIREHQSDAVPVSPGASVVHRAEHAFLRVHRPMLERGPDVEDDVTGSSALEASTIETGSPSSSTRKSRIGGAAFTTAAYRRELGQVRGDRRPRRMVVVGREGHAPRAGRCGAASCDPGDQNGPHDSRRADGGREVCENAASRVRPRMQQQPATHPIRVSHCARQSRGAAAWRLRLQGTRQGPLAVP